MNLIDEEDIAPLQVREDTGQVTLALDGRTARDLDIGAHLLANDVGEGGLSQTWRAAKEHMVQRLPSSAGGGDEDPQIVDDRRLSNVSSSKLFGRRERSNWASSPCTSGVMARSSSVVMGSGISARDTTTPAPPSRAPEV